MSHRTDAVSRRADPVSHGADLDHSSVDILFGDDGHGDHGRRRRRPKRRHSRPRTSGRAKLLLALGAILIVAIGVLGGVVLRDKLMTPDYSGTGTGSVEITVHSGDTVAGIATTLVDAGVVKSSAAFVNAVNKQGAAGNLQPGVYTLHRHMSGESALQLMLAPASRAAGSEIVIPEGANELEVAASLAKALDTSEEKVRAVMANTSALSLPANYQVDGNEPSSVEGFLYPATYPVTSGTEIADMLNTMIARYTSQDRQDHYATTAADHHITPYEMLTIASIAQAEAKFPQDMPKVARVILNRLADGKPLQIDATSVYAAKLQGLDPSKVIYAEIDSPYNTYTHKGLPPTPISNPGADALAAAASPAEGDWLYYVNGDAEGHLFFTNSEAAFVKAAAKCKAEGWGCG